MTEQRRPGKYPAELRDRAVGMVFESEQHFDTQRQAVCSVAEKLAPMGETVRKWVRRVEIDEGASRATTDERDAIEQFTHLEVPRGHK